MPQILSVISGCKVGASNTGATGQTRKDVYKYVTDEMGNLIDKEMVYDRSDVKAAFMTHFYGSKAEPKKAFGEDTPELEAFYQATEIVCPGASMLLPIMLGLWNPEAYEYRCDLPDGFQVIMKVKDTVDQKIEIDTIPGHPVFTYRHKVNKPLKEGLFIPANVTQAIDAFIVRELTSRCAYNAVEIGIAEGLLIKRLNKSISVPKAEYLYPEKMWHKHEFMSLVGIEFVNNWSVNQMSDDYCMYLLKLIRKVKAKKSFTVVCIHDEFKCLPNYMNHVRQCYIDILTELADSDILNAMLSDIAGREMNIDKLSNNLSDEIRKSEYAIA